MNKAPWLKFYAADWRMDATIQGLSLAARGTYIDLVADAWMQPECGVLRADLRTTCARLRSDLRLLNRLQVSGLLTGDDNYLRDPLVYRPRHGRTEGDPVVLLQSQQGPIWFLPRILIDQYVDGRRGGSDRSKRLKASPIRPNGESPIRPIGDSPIGTPEQSITEQPPPTPATDGANSPQQRPCDRTAEGALTRKGSKAIDPWPGRIPHTTEEDRLAECAIAYGLGDPRASKKYSDWTAVQNACFTARRRLKGESE